MAGTDFPRIKRGFGLKLFIFAILVFSIAGCRRAYSSGDFRKAIEVAYQRTLKPTGVSLRGFLFVLRYDNNPSANAVALFYIQNHRESFMFLKSRFNNPAELQNWLIIYVKENIEVRYE